MCLDNVFMFFQGLGTKLGSKQAPIRHYGGRHDVVLRHSGKSTMALGHNSLSKEALQFPTFKVLLI